MRKIMIRLRSGVGWGRAWRLMAANDPCRGSPRKHIRAPGRRASSLVSGGKDTLQGDDEVHAEIGLEVGVGLTSAAGPYRALAHLTRHAGGKGRGAVFGIGRMHPGDEVADGCFSGPNLAAGRQRM